MENSLFSRVVDCIAKTTRYPNKLLQPQADLEIDLGIDSVKRLEIVVALEKEFGLELASQPRDSSIKTIQDIAGWVEGMMGSSSSPAAEVADQPGNGATPHPPAPRVVPTPKFELHPPAPAPPVRFENNVNKANFPYQSHQSPEPARHSVGYFSKTQSEASIPISLTGMLVPVTQPDRSG